MKVGVIINPHAKGNRSRPQRAKELQALLGESARVVSTMSAEDVGFHLERFRAQGIRYIVADGGDGTLHTILNQAIQRLGAEAVQSSFSFLPTSNGTINYMARVAGFNGDSEDTLRKLRTMLKRGLEPDVMPVPTLRNTGRREDAAGNSVEWGCYSWSNAIGGYAANFHQRWYDSHLWEGAPRIVALAAEGVGSFVADSVFRGPLRAVRPKWVDERAAVYLPPTRGKVWVDGEVFRAPDGSTPDSFALLNAGAVPVNLAGVFKVFPQANLEAIHIHVGNLGALPLAKAFVKSFRNESISSATLYDGLAQELRIECAPGTSLCPSMDGEMYSGLTELRVERGPVVSFVTI